MEERTQKLAQAITEAARRFAGERGAELPQGFAAALERPKREGQGDWASNAAMKLAKVFGMKPMELANELIARLGDNPDIESAEAAPPGFMNFTLSGCWAADAVMAAVKAGESYGRCDDGAGRRVQVEFVSANPTGPIHLGHGRGAAVGDVMASILDFAGWKVEREYYINDAGLQIRNLGLSTRSRYYELLGRGDEAPFPDDGYPGEYIYDTARALIDEYGDKLTGEPEGDSFEIFKYRTCADVLSMIRRDLADFGVEFDVWFSERDLYKDDTIPRTLDILRGAGYAYDAEGAVWFKSTAFGDDKDRVMVRANGEPTYFTSDTAYLQNKYERGFDRIIYVWGADHHGYVPRVRSVSKALGADDSKLSFLLIQFVSLLRDGEPVAMSKREGTFVELRTVMDEVGRDAARFSFVGRKCDSHLEFDLELAKKQSSENPVYYVQYAHARICSILREAAARGVALPEAADLSLLSSPCEMRLIKEISRFPEEVRRAAHDLEPHKIAFYASAIAEAFHVFYNSEHVLGEPEEVTKARLMLAEAARVTISNALRLLGVSAPERM